MYPQNKIIPVAQYPTAIESAQQVSKVIYIDFVDQYSTDFIYRFVDYIDRKDSTTKDYITCLKQFGYWMRINDITQPKREDIQAYRDYLKDSDLAATTQAHYLRTVKQFFKWTASENLYPNIADNVHGAKVDSKMHKKDALTRDDAIIIANSIERETEQGKRAYAMYLLCVVNGLRDIEIHRANICDVKTAGNTVYLYVQGKGHDDKDAPVLLVPEVKAAIDDYIQSRTDNPTAKSPLFVSTSNRSKPGSLKGYKKDRYGNYVLDANGDRVKVLYDGRIAPSTISTILKTILVNAGYNSDRLTAHSLRHTSGTAAMLSGVSLYEAQNLMRHKDPATTEIYIHTNNHEAQEKRGRTAIYNYLFGNDKINPIIPELETEIKKLSEDEQRELLHYIREHGGQKCSTAPLTKTEKEV